MSLFNATSSPAASFRLFASALATSAGGFFLVSATPSARIALGSSA
jgi:hypothetical protein